MHMFQILGNIYLYKNLEVRHVLALGAENFLRHIGTLGHLLLCRVTRGMSLRLNKYLQQKHAQVF